MIVEHTFVTTYEWPDVSTLALSFLGLAGFTVQAASEGLIEARRGRTEPRGGRVSTLPQTFRLEFDRGRVAIAAGIRGVNDKDHASFAPLLTLLVQAIEGVLVYGHPIENCLLPWRNLEAQTRGFSGPGTRVAIGCLIGLVVIVVVAIFVAAISSRSLR